MGVGESRHPVTPDVASLPRRFRQYPEYRDSGVSWIGTIPSHWEVSRTKRVARLRSGHTPSRLRPEYWENCTIPWFGLADVWQIRDGKRDVVTETSEKISELGLANSAARLLPKGTVMLSRTASVGFSAIMGVDMATTQDFVNWVCGPRIRPEYLLQVFRSMGQEFERLTMGSTHQTIYMPDVGQFSTLVPPSQEQRTIAAFLARETAKIDVLVSSKERLIRALRERSAIDEAALMTQGIEPERPRVQHPSVDWIDTVPAHWTVARNWRLFRERDDRGFPELPLLSVSIDTGVTIRELSSDHIEQMSDDPSTCKRAKAGDIVFNKMRMWQGAVGVAPVDGLVSPDYTVARPLDGVDPHYFVALFRSPPYLAEIFRRSKGMVLDRNRLYWDDFKSILSIVPPLEEQRRMVAQLVATRHRHEATTERVARAIDRLREYRAALITAAVTGQIDVRGEIAA